MKIVNVDEQGKILNNIDWTLWEREYIEEKTDEEGLYVLSHCIPKESKDIPTETISAEEIAQALQEGVNTI